MERLPNLKANNVVRRTMANNKIPIPKCIATVTACNFRSMTIAPNVI